MNQPESITARFGDDPHATDHLFALVYDELRRVAHHHLRKERGGHALSTTALVHECYLGLAKHSQLGCNDRTHFLALASRAMRHILVDFARQRGAQKRGGDRHRITLDDALVAVDEQAAELVALNDALDALGVRHERMARVVECRFFGGMTVEETAAALAVSERTVERDWTRAKAHLRDSLEK